MRCRNAYLAFNAREYSFFLVPYLETLAAASKKAIGLTTTLHVHRAFWNISLPPPHDYGVKVPSFTFVEGKNRRQRLFFFFSWTSIQSLKFNSEKVADIWRTERRRHCCLRSLFSGGRGNVEYNFVTSFTKFDWSVIFSSRSKYGTCENEYLRASEKLKPRPHVSGYFWIRIFFLCGLGFRPHVSGESGIRIRNFWNPLSRVEIFEYATNRESCGR